MEIIELKKDLAATFRWAARLNMNEGVANHFSACIPGSTDEFLVNKSGIHFSQMKVSDLRASYPSYFMSKKKIELTPTLDVDNLLKEVEQKFANEEVTTIDGVKIDFENNWVHLRKSNTEPIIRIYTEAPSQQEADELADKMIADIKTIAKL